MFQIDASRSFVTVAFNNHSTTDYDRTRAIVNGDGCTYVSQFTTPNRAYFQKVVQCNERQLRAVSGTTRSRPPKEHHRRVPMDTAKRVHTAT